MKVTISLNSNPAVHVPVRVIDGCVFAEVDATCHHCGHDPLRIYGEDRTFGSDDRSYEAIGYCHDCRKRVGLIFIKVHTIWGVREDAAVFAEVEERGGRVY